MGRIPLFHVGPMELENLETVLSANISDKN